MTKIKVLPEELQQEILALLESNKTKEEFIKASKIRQARIIISLKNKYEFKKRSLGMN